MSNKYTVSIGTLDAFQGRPEELRNMYLAIGYSDELGHFDVDTFNIRVSDFLESVNSSFSVATNAQKGVVQLGELEERIDDVLPDGTPITKWELVNASDDPDYIVPTRKDVIQALGHCLRTGDDIDGNYTHILLKELVNTTSAGKYLNPRELGAVLVYNEDGSVNTGSLIYRLSANDKDDNPRFVTFPSGTDFNSVTTKLKELENTINRLSTKVDEKLDKTGGDVTGTINFLLPSTDVSGAPELLDEDFLAISSSDSQSPGSLAGTGVQMVRDHKTGKWSLSIDNIVVRTSMYVPELVIEESRSIAGSLIISPGYGVVKSIVDEDTSWKLLLDTDDSDSELKFDYGDFVRCSKYHKGELRSYWLPILDLDKKEKSITIPKSDVDPKIEDKLAVFGNIDNPKRQSLIVISGSETNSPTISMYDNLNQNTNRRLSECLVSAQGNLDGIVSPEFGALSGIGFYIKGNTYISGKFRVLSNDGTTYSYVPCNKGKYNHTEVYYIGDEVTSQGALWQFLGDDSNQTSKGQIPSEPLWLKRVDKGERGDSNYAVDIYSTAGDKFKNNNVRTTLIASIKYGSEDVTHLFDDSEIVWLRTSGSASESGDDLEWNYTNVANKVPRHIGPELELYSSDVRYKAVFDCYVYDNSEITSPSKISLRKLITN